MSKYSVSDDHWNEDEEPDPESPVSIDSHTVDVILTTDPTEKHGYGREKYTVYVTHSFDDSPVVTHAIEHRWKGNYWREVREWDWHDVPGAVKKQVAHVVDCEGARDLHPGDRLVGEGGDSTFTRGGSDE